MFQVTGSVSRGSFLEYWIRDRYTSKIIWKFLPFEFGFRIRTWFKWVRILKSGFVTVQFEDFVFLPGFWFQDPDPSQVGSNLGFRIRNGHNSKFFILFTFWLRISGSGSDSSGSESWIRIRDCIFFLNFRFLPLESGLQEFWICFKRIWTLDPDPRKVPLVPKNFFQLFVPGSQDYRDFGSVSRGFGPWIRICEEYLHF